MNDEHQWAVRNYMEAVYLMTVCEQNLYKDVEVLFWSYGTLWIVLDVLKLDTFGMPEEYQVIAVNPDGMMMNFYYEDYMMMYYRNS